MKNRKKVLNGDGWTVEAQTICEIWRDEGCFSLRAVMAGCQSLD